MTKLPVSTDEDHREEDVATTRTDEVREFIQKLTSGYDPELDTLVDDMSSVKITIGDFPTTVNWLDECILPAFNDVWDKVYVPTPQLDDEDLDRVNQALSQAKEAITRTEELKNAITILIIGIVGAEQDEGIPKHGYDPIPSGVRHLAEHFKSSMKYLDALYQSITTISAQHDLAPLLIAVADVIVASASWKLLAAELTLNKHHPLSYIPDIPAIFAANGLAPFATGAPLQAGICHIR